MFLPLLAVKFGKFGNSIPARARARRALPSSFLPSEGGTGNYAEETSTNSGARNETKRTDGRRSGGSRASSLGKVGRKRDTCDMIPGSTLSVTLLSGRSLRFQSGFT